jgi:hypothetical protein
VLTDEICLPQRKATAGKATKASELAAVKHVDESCCKRGNSSVSISEITCVDFEDFVAILESIYCLYIRIFVMI